MFTAPSQVSFLHHLSPCYPWFGLLFIEFSLFWFVRVEATVNQRKSYCEDLSFKNSLVKKCHGLTHDICCVGFGNILLKVSQGDIKTFPRSKGFESPLKAAISLLEDYGSTALSREALIPSLQEVRHRLLSPQAAYAPTSPTVWGGGRVVLSLYS